MSAPLVWVPNLADFLVAAGVVFGGGGLLVMVVGCIRIVLDERAKAGRA